MNNQLKGTLDSNSIELTGSIESSSFIAEVWFSKIRGEVEDNPQLVEKFAKYQPLIDDLEEIRENASSAVKGLAEEIERATTKENELTEALTLETTTREEADKLLQESIDKEEANRKTAIKAIKDTKNSFIKTFEISNPSELTYTIFHNLSTKDLLIQAYLIDGIDLKPTIKRGYDDVTLTFDSIPEDTFRVDILALNEWSVQKLAFDLPMM